MTLRALLLALLVGAAIPAAAGGQAPAAPPETTITSGPATTLASSTATFAFTSSQAGSRFACALDDEAFKDCASPFTIAVAADGEHQFYVIAVSPEGNTDPTPAVWTWTADTRPPTAVRRHEAVVRYRKLVLSWGSLSAAGADLVVVLRSTRPGQSPIDEVYRGSGSSYADAKFRNGVYHRYRIVASDHAGNTSPPVDVVVGAAALLLAPKDGARVSAPPGLRWRAVPRAAYYNVQLYRRGAKLLSVWPRPPRLELSRSWTYRGHHYSLTPGHYTWFMWPGFGPLVRGRYGSLLGQGSFDVGR
jgi:hypothetical protein